MSLSFDLRDLAHSAAKKFDHDVVRKAHLLYALKRRFLRELEQVDIGVIEAELAKAPRAATANLTIDSEVEILLQSITNDERAMAVAADLLFEVLGITFSSSLTLKKLSSDSSNQSLETIPVSLENSLEKLNSLIGLDDVKKQVLKLISVHQANHVRAEQGMKKVPVGLHCVFTGSPGTGKTTVARYVAEMYHAIGLLPTSKLIEVDRSSLVAGYVGQTALKVQEAIQSALGGVLFIDEAYSLTSDSGAGFGDEAVSTLVKAMEDHRDNLAVVVAGYRDPIKHFIESNQGLKSRFQTFINFPDYSADELLQIFHSLCHSHEMKVSAQMNGDLLNYLSLSNPQGEHGNARFVRNLFEKMYLNLSHRAAEDGIISLNEVVEFAVDDIPGLEPKKRTIGFSPH